MILPLLDIRRGPERGRRALLFTLAGVLLLAGQARAGRDSAADFQAGPLLASPWCGAEFLSQDTACETNSGPRLTGAGSAASAAGPAHASARRYPGANVVSCSRQTDPGATLLLICRLNR